uniref:Aminotransferase class V domain-containing protein n=1 Tax=Romanomermis culicivorax TaxID=13658 RepID=A0A915KV39_ROMCU
MIGNAQVYTILQFVAESQARFHGYDPHDALIILEPRPDEFCLRIEDILKCIEDHGREIALILFSGVQYYTGQLFDVPTITTAAQEKGCVIGWDMAHAVGNMPLHLHDWGVDFAVWCSYKYVNSSAGGIGAVFLHERHARNDYPKLSGWWSDDAKHRMMMTNELHLSPGASGYRISNPPALLICPLLASLDIFAKTSMETLRQKSILLTGYLEYLLDKFLNHDSPYRQTLASCRIITPRSIGQRGCQLSLIFSIELDSIFVELEKRGVVCDKRLPYVLRITPVHLYNSFDDVKRFIDVLIDCLKKFEKK